MSSGLTTFKVDGVEGKALQNELWKRGKIQPRALGENRGVRYSTHIYNCEEEIDRTLQIIEELTCHIHGQPSRAHGGKDGRH